ncbi:serine/threonine-protein kinase fray2 [Amborella trichopoda]|nr:serine/threonine-protein kinase fray2 [Amborella trichopoda]|eukprot:XP_006844998.2 serine/threonine-protein kinase fray2 [Amborella trichopoda]
MDHAYEKKYPLSSKDYRLYEEVGEGVSASVYRALCIPLNEIVAIKVLDLEKCNNDLDGIRREVQMMSLIDHPNLLRAHCSFTADHNLWVVMPYMAGGSCLHIMKTTYPEGFDEPVIATLLREVLKALVYLHGHGHIHRDVKAGNILVDGNGAVKLADFGVSACMFDTGDRQRSRNTFVGTPCWMAPEVMQQLHGYDFKADIWSFGITALELAHGHAPFSKYPPMKVLLMTLQNAPPGLDYERDRRFSRNFKEMVAACLVKDPKKRPSSEKLLKHHFFKHARSNEYIARTILDGLSPLGDRFRALKAKEADLLLQNKAMYGDKEQKSQHEYIRGISAWNFNLDDLKAQASLIQDYDENPGSNDINMNGKEKAGFNDAPDPLSPNNANHDTSEIVEEDGDHILKDRERPFPSSFPLHPLEALKGYFDVTEDDINSSSPKEGIQSEFEPQEDDQEPKPNENEGFERSFSSSKVIINPLPGRGNKFLSGSLIPERVTRSGNGDGDRGNLQHGHHGERNYSGPLPHRAKRDSEILSSAHTNALDDSHEGPLVQRKGRFKVTSDVGMKVKNLGYRLKDCYYPDIPEMGTDEGPQPSPSSSRERELQTQMVQLQQRIGSLVEELQRVKIKNAQLERQLNTLSNKEEEERIRKENEDQ